MADPKNSGKTNIDSSVVIRGLGASTFSEMETFVQDLEERPIERLFRDLPQFAELSATKFQLVSYLLAGKYRQASSDEKAKMKSLTEMHLAAAPEGEARERIEQILSRLQ